MTDLMMPAMDGVSFIQKIRQGDFQIKILAISGVQSDENIQKAFAAGANSFLAKPFSVEDFKQKIAETLKPVSSTPPELQKEF